MSEIVAPHSLNLYQKIAAMIGEIGPLAKKKKNEHFSYNYVGHEQLMEALAPLLAKYGVIIEPPEPMEFGKFNAGTTKSGTQKIITRVKYQSIIRNADKPDEMMTKHTWAEALDSEDKGFNKCSTQADKYLTLRLFRIATPADDPDALHSKDSDYEADFDKRTEGQKRIAQYQVHAFNEACSNNGKTPEMISAYLKTKFHHVQVEQLMRSEFSEAIQWASNKADFVDTAETSLRAISGRRSSKSLRPEPTGMHVTDGHLATGD